MVSRAFTSGWTSAWRYRRQLDRKSGNQRPGRGWKPGERRAIEQWRRRQRERDQCSRVPDRTDYAKSRSRGSKHDWLLSQQLSTSRRSAEPDRGADWNTARIQQSVPAGAAQRWLCSSGFQRVVPERERAERCCESVRCARDSDLCPASISEWFRGRREQPIYSCRGEEHRRSEGNISLAIVEYRCDRPQSVLGPGHIERRFESAAARNGTGSKGRG